MLRSHGFQFYDWSIFGAGVIRIVTGFSTTTEDTEALLATIRAAS